MKNVEPTHIKCDNESSMPQLDYDRVFSHLTREDIEAATLDVKPPWWPWDGMPQKSDRGRTIDALYSRVQALFPEASELVDEMQEQFKRSEKVDPSLFQRFREFRPLVLLFAWKRATQGGISNIGFIKCLYQQVGALVLGAFGVPVGDAGVGVLPHMVWFGEQNC